MPEVVTVTDAKARLSELVAAVATTQDHVDITRNGQPAVVLISHAELTRCARPLPFSPYIFVTERLPTSAHRLGGELSGPYKGKRAAHLGTYRVVYAWMKPFTPSTYSRSGYAATSTGCADPHRHYGCADPHRHAKSSLPRRGVPGSVSGRE